MSQTKKTPKDFAPHLVAVLGRLAEYTPGTSVQMERTFAPVCAAVGIDEDALGASDGHKSKATHRQISLAMRQLRDHGTADYAKRGHWYLTPKGVSEALADAGLPPMEETGEESDEEILAARSDATAEEVGAEAEGAEVMHLPGAAAPHPYSDDPYIRSLAIENLECFGAHSARSTICKTCPLAGDCLLAVSARKGELAAKLDADDALAQKTSAEHAKARAVKDASVDELIDKMNADSPKQSARVQGGSKGKFQPASDQDVAPAFAQRESRCEQCEESIPEDDPCLWVQDEGMFHNECVETTSP